MIIYCWWRIFSSTIEHLQIARDNSTLVSRRLPMRLSADDVPPFLVRAVRTSSDVSSGGHKAVNSVKDSGGGTILAQRLALVERLMREENGVRNRNFDIHFPYRYIYPQGSAILT